MSLIVDQSWVKDWRGAPTPFQKDLLASWLSTQSRQWHPLLKEFPPFCLVKAKTTTMDVPCPFSVAVVNAYYEDGTLAISQEPFGENVAVSPDDVEVVGYWKGLNPDAIQRLLS